MKYKPQFVINDKLYYNLFPIILQKYWYFTAYFGMYLFLPIINKGIIFLEKSDLKICFISIHIIFVFWHDIMNYRHDIFKTSRGFSVLWLLIYYITGAYFSKYKIILLGTKKIYFFLIYIFISILYYIIYNYKINSFNKDIKFKFYQY